MNNYLTEQQINNLFRAISFPDRKWALVIVDENNEDYRGDILIYICGYSLNKILEAQNSWAASGLDTTNLQQRVILANSDYKFSQRELLFNFKRDREGSLNNLVNRFLASMIQNGLEYIDQDKRFSYMYNQYKI